MLHFIRNIRIVLISSVSFLSIIGMEAQITGLWGVPDEHDGIIKSIVEIYEEGNAYHGRVAQVLDSSKHTHCERCVGDLKDKPLTGMLILYDLKKTSTGGTDGKVLNPGTGKVYSCNIELHSKDTLKIRGYIGLPALGKSIFWKRMKSNT